MSDTTPVVSDAELLAGVERSVSDTDKSVSAI
jgi:hypothetical protein